MREDINDMNHKSLPDIFEEKLYSSGMEGVLSFIFIDSK